ncbi:MAG: hybrid sensor histidine kinase/response regulator [Burkholderiales bacterium]
MTLRSNLFMLVIGTVVPLTALALVLGYLLVEQERDTFRKGALDRNRAFMTAVDAELRGHLMTLQALAAAKSLQTDDLRAFHDDAQRAKATQADWQNVILALPSGQQIVNASQPFGTTLRVNSDTESANRLIRSVAPTVGNIIFGRTMRKYGIPVRVPIVRNGSLVYILTAVIEPDAFGRLIRAQHLPEGWVSGLVDATGHFVARVPPRAPDQKASADFWSAMQRSKEGWYRGLTIEGQDTFTAHKASDLSNWSVGLGIPASEVNAAANRAAWTMGAGALATLALALGFALIMGRRISQPIASVAAAARSLGRDTRTADVAADTGITEIREVAEALNEASVAIRERHDLVEREQAALRAADRAKDEFLAMLGHELRNPLGAITTSAHVLRLAKPGDDMAVKAQAVIERQTRHMTRLVEDLLDVSRVTMGKIELRHEVFDLSELAMRLLPTWEQGGRRKHGRVSIIAEPVWVNADRARIEQVVCNLLDNADKFSPQDKTIRVRIAQEAKQAVLEVTDEGEGIAPEMLERIFGLFVQGPRGPDRSGGGMGVGLALVRRLVEMHGGVVSGASKGPGQGAVFTMRLPAVSKPAGEVVNAETVGVSSNARRILVVEDNEDARGMMHAMLTLEGHSVRTAADGATALEQAETWQPDVVLMDIGLPDMIGYDVARRMRQSRLDGHVKLVAITGYGQAQDERRAYEAGFDLHLTKPVSADLLRNVLSVLLRDVTPRNDSSR